MEILEKVAYMKGLAEGLGLDTKSKEGKLFTIIMDILDDMALELQDLHGQQDDLQSALDAVSDDLSSVEACVFETDGEEDNSSDGVYQTTCPNCEEDIFFDESILEDGAVKCPCCGKKLEFELEEDGCEPEEEFVELTDEDLPDGLPF